MTLRYVGYGGQNLSLPATTGRTLRLASLTPDRVREKAAANLADLLQILYWNVDRGIRFFRVSSDVISFASHAEFPIDWRSEFAGMLRKIRDFAAAQACRLTMHPGQYTVLNSPRPEVVTAAVSELEYHAEILEEIDPSTGTFTLHVGGTYGDKSSALVRFVENFDLLSDRAKSRMTLENDDTTYSAGEVLALCRMLEVPMVYDHHHHKSLPTTAGRIRDGIPLLEHIVDTWSGAVPKCHLSSLKKGTRTAHDDLVARVDFDAFLALMEEVRGRSFDLMLEAKLKDKAVLRLMEAESMEAGSVESGSGMGR